MGARLCCAQRGAADDAVVVVERKGEATSRAFLSAELLAEKGVVVGDSDGSGAYLYEDEEGADIFFSAKESLAQVVSELPYPPTATRKPGRSRNVTVDHPESLLQSSGEFLPRNELPTNDGAMDVIDELLITATPSTEFLTERLTEELTLEAGYPGELSKDELEACLEFRQRLKEHSDPTYRDMVYLNVDVDIDADVMNGESANANGTQRAQSTSSVAGRGPEEEAFALCRFLRARQFDVDKTFAMMDERLALFKEALTKYDLHRSKTVVEDHIGCPLPVFINQFPLLDYGLAKNGAFVVYLKAGLIRLQDGFDCINKAGTPKSFVERYMPMAWYITCRVFCETMHRLQKERQNTNNGNDFVVLAEVVAVVDMEGLRRDLFSTRTMEFLQQVLGVIQCFPEILNRVIVVNVPYFFTFIWGVLKHFIDARTVRKIGFFSSLASAQNDLLELVDPSQVLLEYGGENGNPTYEEALAMNLKRDGEFDRYIFERYSTKTTKMPSGTDSVSLQTFSLNETEEAGLTVYTQAKLDTSDGKSKAGTQFLLLPFDVKDSESIRNELERENCNGNGNCTTLPHRFGQPEATTREHSRVIGPGKFRLVVKKTKGKASIEKALLVVSIG